MTLYYSAEDEKLLLASLSYIGTKRRRMELKLKPTDKERGDIFKVIRDFISRKKRIVYGGYALHLLIRDRSNEDYIYTDIDFPDIEFYTPYFKEDIKELTDLLAETFSYVTAEEGVHPTTFLIKVEFEGVCDVTFQPKRFYEVIPTVLIDGLRVITPEFAMVDIFRVYNFPINNYFRLEKTYKRANLLLKHYPLEFSTQNKTNSHNINATQLMDTIKLPSNVIVTDVYAKNYFCKHVDLPEENNGTIVLISVSFFKDVRFFKNQLKMRYRLYLPFLDILGQRADFVDNTGNVVLRIIEEVDTCIPYIQLTNCKITTIQGTVYYSLVSLYQAVMEHNTDSVNHHNNIISELIKAKMKYYSLHPEQNIIKAGPFQEFVIDCIGKAVGALRKAGITRTARKKAKQALKYRYDPGEKNPAFESMNITLSTGQRVRSEKIHSK